MEKLSETRIPLIDLETNEDDQEEALLLYSALGQCNIDKSSVLKEVEKINNE